MRRINYGNFNGKYSISNVVDNVLAGIANGVTEIDFWTSGKIPVLKTHPYVSKIEVYYKGNLILQGTIIDRYRKAPVVVFDTYNNYNSNGNLYSIGLEQGKNPAETSTDFENMLKAAFSQPRKGDIGNIIIGNITVVQSGMGIHHDFSGMMEYK